MKGYFVVYENEDEQFDIKCDLRPDIDDEVPEAQSILYSEVENTCNVLKALDKTSDDIKRKLKGEKEMLSPQLKKLKTQLEEGMNEIDIDKEELLAELNEMDAIEGVLLESLSLSTRVCPTCGKRL